MIVATRGTQGWAVSALTLAILATRVGHFGTFETPPDFTLAAFFLAGLWVRSAWVFAFLVAAAGAADQIAFAQAVSDWCMSPAYGFLLPAYACVWLAGRASRSIVWRRPPEATRGAANLLAALLAAFVISNGSFFLLADYFEDMSGVEYWIATAPQFPHYITWAFAYTAVALLLRETIVAVLARHRERDAAAR
jgi:hypothetical protein